MIEAKRKMGWRFLLGAIGCFVMMCIVSGAGLGQSPADVYFLIPWFAGLVLYFIGLYFIVKARGRHGAWAGLGAMFVLGWNVIAQLEDRAVSPMPPSGQPPSH